MEIPILIVLLLSQCQTSVRATYFETYYIPPTARGRNALSIEQFKWPNGTVPYIFSGDYTEDDQRKVIEAVKIFPRETCTKFVPKTSEHRDYIKFVKSNSCGARIGYRANLPEPLQVDFSDYCLTIPGAIQHELFHVLGILHEQSRYDRDENVDILWDNIDPLHRDNFLKVPKTVTDTFNLPYDFKSLMHYPRNAFAKDPLKPTMVSKGNPDMELGNQKGPTKNDLEKLRRMYKCT